MAVLNKRKIIGSTFLHLTTWLHNILSRSISYLQNDSGIGGFFSPLKYFISVALSSTLFRFFCFNLGIGVFDGSYLCVGWAMIVAILCVSFNPFWKWICASKLSATIWIRPSLALTSLFLIPDLKYVSRSIRNLPDKSWLASSVSHWIHPWDFRFQWRCIHS